MLTACHDAGTAPAQSTRGGPFDAFWSAYDQTYPYFEYKAVDWNAARDRYRAAAVAAPTTDSLVQVLRAMVAPLNDGHIAFISPSGTFLQAYTPRGRPNFESARWNATVTAAGWTQLKPNLGYAKFGDVGYITVGSWNSSQFAQADLDAALDAVRGSRALIVDVRANGGGNDALAFLFAARFSSSTIAAGSVRYRSGRGLGAPIVRTIPARGPWTWTAPVVLLIGRQGFSSNESFIAALATLPHVTTLGDTTGGGSGNPETRPLGGGWSYRLPRWIEYAPDGHVVEWNGVAPAVVVPYDTAGRPVGEDPIIRAARVRLGQVP